MGKVPFLERRRVASRIDGLRRSVHPLLPADPFAAATSYLELHLELVAPASVLRLARSATNSGAAVRPQLERSAAAFARFNAIQPPWRDPGFTLADCAAVVHLPIVSGASKIIYSRDLLAALPIRTM